MSIAPDPETDNNTVGDDDFDKHFAEFAEAKSKGEAPPNSEAPVENGEPEGNDPPKDAAAPVEEEKPQAATDEAPTGEPVTSGDAEDTDGGSQPPSEEQAPDPWADAPEPLKAELARLQKERDEALHRAKSDANRVAALSRKLQQVQAAPAPQAPEPTEAQKALDSKIAKLREEYGDIADPLIELIETQKKELEGQRAVLAGLTEAQQAQVIASETQALEARHPDWREVAQSPEFAGWLVAQPKNIQGLAESWDARETSVVLTLFKTEVGMATGQKAEAAPKEQAPEAEPKPKADAATGARRSQQLDGGRDVRSRPAPASSEPPDDFDAAFKYFEEKRRQKQALAR